MAGVSTDKLQELNTKTHYLESTDEKLNLRHGLGVLLVRQIVRQHNGTMKIESMPNCGYKTTLIFSISIKKRGLQDTENLFFVYEFRAIKFTTLSCKCESYEGKKNAKLWFVYDCCHDSIKDVFFAVGNRQH